VPQAEAIARGHDQVVFLDAQERKWIEELGGMNLYLRVRRRHAADPGAHRHDPARHHPRQPAALAARRRPESARGALQSRGQWRADAASGRLVETFACGTAAVVTPVGKVAGRDGEFTIGSAAAPVS
jgi:branched-chain amino acid aminotransferase